jgi:hypothetical protein
MPSLEEHAAHNAEAEQKILSDVEQYGFHIAQLHGDGYSPSFAYTPLAYLKPTVTPSLSALG